MAGYYSYHTWEDDDDGRDGLIDFEQYYTFPSRSKNHAGGQGILHRLLKRQYRPVDDNCHHAKKKQQLVSQNSKSLSQSKGRQWGAADRCSNSGFDQHQPCQAQGSPTTPAAMRAFSSSNNLRPRQKKEFNPDQSTRQSGADGAPTPASPSTNATTATSADQQPNLFSRLLRRAQSKKTLRPAKPNTAEERHDVPQLPAVKESRYDGAVRGEDDNQRTTVAERKPTLRLRKSIRQRLRGPEQQPRQPEAKEITNKPAPVYVPRHAAADFTRTAVPKSDAAARFASLDEPRRRPSSSHAPVSPNLERPRTSPGHQHSQNDNDDNGTQQLVPPQPNTDMKRRSWAMSNTESRKNRFSFASYNAEADYGAVAPSSPVVDSDETPLHPSNNPDMTEQQRQRQSKRHSYRLVPDPHDAVIEEETDFQRFLNKAAEEDRQYRQDLWRTLSQHSRAAGGAGILPPPPMDNSDLDLQALLGGVDWSATTKQQQRERSNSYNKRASNSHRKRASMISYRSQTDRSGKQQQQQQLDLGDAPALPSPVKRKPSVTKRVQEYFKPEALSNPRD
ncbi:hypothetical protein PG989_006245 [Apiospora arundinis]|uniref:Uncharacterized protein n=1 Tax=Apiospora arundinis TaxID=335852 RepID=A0ABR2IVL1_9PEZI